MEIHINHKRVEFKSSLFAGGEMNFSLPVNTGSPFNVSIMCNLHSSDDIFLLLLATDSLRRQGAKAIRLTIPYLPYARQDRVCNAGEALSIRVLADIINAQKYYSVEVWDAHSDVSVALIDRCTNRPPEDFLSDFEGRFNKANTILVAPDAGSIKKVSSIGKKLNMPFVRADKTRAITGEITGTVVYSDHIDGKDFLIVDDICDGGRTFIALAEQLRPLTNGRVLLYVTHGIFSYGTAVFDGIIDTVLVANSFVKNLPENFHSLN